MESYDFKKANKSLENQIIKNSRRNNNYSPNSSFETTILPILCVKQPLKQKRKDIYGYPVFKKQDLNSSLNNSNEKELENVNYNNNSRSLNNFSKVVVTLKVKKETLRNKIFSNDQLPLLKSAIYSYNNNIKKNNEINNDNKYNGHSIKKKDIYSPNIIDSINGQLSPYFDKKQFFMANIRESPLITSHNDETLDYSYNKYLPNNLVHKEKSFVWKNMDKVLNKKQPENPPG